jgi:hypothetical protein
MPTDKFLVSKETVDKLLAEFFESKRHSIFIRKVKDEGGKLETVSTTDDTYEVILRGPMNFI